MGKFISKKWLRSILATKNIKFQSATWLANVGHSINVNRDEKFKSHWSLCEPELFPGSRLIGVKGRKGAKVNIFNSGKCICMGKYFRSKTNVVNVLSNLNI